MGECEARPAQDEDHGGEHSGPLELPSALLAERDDDASEPCRERCDVAGDEEHRERLRQVRDPMS